jgi:methyl-accepting chemotaxis protein
MYSMTPAPLLPKRRDGLHLPILIACGLLSILVAAMTTLSLKSIMQVSGFAHEAVDVDGQLSRLASDVANQTLESRRYEKDFFLNVEDSYVRQDYLTKWSKSAQALDHAIAAFSAAASTPEDQQQATSWHREASQYITDFKQVAQAVNNGHIITSEDANEAFTPFKENIRILTDSSVAIADQKATLAEQTSTTIAATGTRTIWLVGLLGFVALSVAVGYGIADTLSFGRYCVDCNEHLPIDKWFGGEHRCLQCELHRLARLINQAAARKRRN